MDIIDQTLKLTFAQQIGLAIGAILLLLSLFLLICHRLRKNRIRRRIRKIRKRKSSERIKKTHKIY